MDFYVETEANDLTVFLNFPYWLASSPADLGLKPSQLASTLDGIRQCWRVRERVAPLIERAELAT